jgi:pimeloyl-ACP methyl ester carboxylesterase
MSLIHHVVTGNGRPPIVFIHGFGCAHSDWNSQVAHLAPRHQTIAVDLRGHGASPGEAADCSVERYGADVAEVMRAMALPPAVLVGHSMGCRVAIEAALQAPSQTAGLILVDGSQFAAAMEPVLMQRFAVTDTKRSPKSCLTTCSQPGAIRLLSLRWLNAPSAFPAQMVSRC